MIRRALFHLKLPTQTLSLGKRTLIMGVLNVTPDSFSDGGQFLSTKRAIQHALLMQHAGADLIDIGAESTRPGSSGTTVTEELRRLVPVLKGLRGKLKIPLSVDTRKAEVAEVALKTGASIINDVSGLDYDPHLAEVVACHGAGLVLMHMRGEPRTMQKRPFARDALKDVSRGLRASIKKAQRAGVSKSQIVVDPGIGFGKSFRQNFELIVSLPKLAKLGYPLLIGTSRKGFLGATLAREGRSVPANERLWATAATVTASILGGAHIVRVHDVPEMLQVARVADFLLPGEKKKA
jgi:dihydropteroate synthase